MTTNLPGAGRLDLSIEPQRIVRWAVLAAVIPLLGGYAQQIPNLFFREPVCCDWFDQFGLDIERSLPTWYASTLIFCIALLMLWCAAAERRQERRSAGGWKWLGYAFIYLSIDEAVSIHEMLTILAQGFPTWGIFYSNFKWLIFGLPLAFVGLLLFLPFWLRLLKLAPRTAIRLALAGVVYLVGAGGGELVGSYLSGNGGWTRPYVLVVMAEETLEVAGLLLAIRCVALHLADSLGGPSFRIAGTAP